MAKARASPMGLSEQLFSLNKGFSLDGDLCGPASNPQELPRIFLGLAAG